MANWVASHLERNPHLARLPVRRRTKYSLHVELPERNTFCAFFTGVPCHYQDEQGEWQPLDTTLQFDSVRNEYFAPGIATRLKPDGSVRIVGADKSKSEHAHQTAHVGFFDPITKRFTTHKKLPGGKADKHRMVSDGADFTHSLHVTERGLREELVIQALPSGDSRAWFGLDSVVDSLAVPDGWIKQEWMAGGHRFRLPRIHDAAGLPGPCFYYAQKQGNKQHLYTLVPMSWLASGVAYPVTIDPEYYGSDVSDGFMQSESTSGYAVAYAGTGTLSALISGVIYGTAYQSATSDGKTTTYWVVRTILPFDTSSLPLDAVIQQVDLTLTPMLVYYSTGISTTMMVVAPAWPNGSDLENWQSISAAPLIGKWARTADLTADLPYEKLDLGNTGLTLGALSYLSLISGNDFCYNAPVVGQDWGFQPYLSEVTEASYRPLLVVTYGEAAPAAGGGAPVFGGHVVRRG
jgi:hypothetical protein